MSTDDATPEFQEFLTSAATARQRLIADSGELDPIEEADRESFFRGMLEAALQFVDVDPARPAFVPLQTPTRRWADNGPESLYRMAFVDEHHRYRISGRRADECYLSVSLYGMESGQPDRQVFSVNHLDLDAAPGRPFELELTPHDGGSVVVTRQYFFDPRRDAPGDFSIEVMEGPAPRPGPARLAEGWRRAARCVEAMTANKPFGDSAPSWASAIPNVLGPPSGRESDPVAGRSAIDQVYSAGPFELADNETLVLDIRFPRCAYASVTVWNIFAQSVDTRFHSSTLNPRSATMTGDGWVWAVVAPSNPGQPNWLDTGGRRRGTVFCRFLMVEGPVEPIGSQVVSTEDL